MRQRHIKLATIEHLKDMGVLVEPMLLEIHHARVHLEIGSGKGQFITKLAKDYPDDLFIAVEMDRNVTYRIAEKKLEQKLDNLMILLTEANHLDLWLKPQQIDTIYLNFSDPWPKARHHKRRLTFPTMLEKYTYLLKKEGMLQFRTDHLGLFEDSISYIEKYFEIYDMTLDLEASSYMTEYEEKKRLLGHIYQLKGTIIHD